MNVGDETNVQNTMSKKTTKKQNELQTLNTHITTKNVAKISPNFGFLNH